MAITVTSKYKPFTYEELVKPLEGYWKEYGEQDEVLSKLKTDASALKSYLDSLPKIQGENGKMAYSAEDQKLVDQYNNYVNAINNISTELASSGFTQNIKSSIKDLPNMYNLQVAPIATAIEKRGKWSDTVRQQEALGNWVDLNPDLIGLSPFMNGNTPEYHIANRDKLGAGISALSKQVTTGMDVERNGDFWEYGIQPSQYLNNQLRPDQAAIMESVEQEGLGMILDSLHISPEQFAKLPQNKQQDILNFVRQSVAEGAVFNRIKANTSSEHNKNKYKVFTPMTMTVQGNQINRYSNKDSFTHSYTDYSIQLDEYKKAVEKLIAENPSKYNGYTLPSVLQPDNVISRSDLYEVVNGFYKIPVTVYKSSSNEWKTTDDYVYVPEGISRRLGTLPDTLGRDDDRESKVKDYLKNNGYIKN